MSRPQRAFPLVRLTTISGESSELHLETCPLMPPVLKEQRVPQLLNMEYFWGLCFNGSNLESNMNSITASPDILALILSQQIVLIPEPDLLEEMCDLQQYNATCPINERKRFSDFFHHGELYEYTLLPITYSGPLYLCTNYEQREIQYDAVSYSQLPHTRCLSNPFFMSWFSLPAVLSIKMLPSNIRKAYELFYELMYAHVPDTFWPEDVVWADYRRQLGEKVEKWQKGFKEGISQVTVVNDQQLGKYGRERARDVNEALKPKKKAVWSDDYPSRRKYSTYDWLDFVGSGFIDVNFSSTDK